MEDITGPIAIGCDHAAYALKEAIKKFLLQKGIEIVDVGTNGEDSVDYPDFGEKVATMVSLKKVPRGILICGTGIGMSMVANRFPGVRAALCSGMYSAAMSRRHNDANILALGSRVIGEGLALEIVRVWLDTPFEGGRHQIRVNKIEQATSQKAEGPNPGTSR
ncbi:MAG: ribose 5-phosphate isomerase B [Desulfobacterales bacterium CG07_land_8_20_14_0_80_52_14]|nr:MAG: ribose 5-phosphate isomerase B [Desulfobacterales bacterium CG23_combo_of_CG06-09_8_20_14_all_52_9]PIU49620.1 MAG: ribose 5-phosphate isomerase B [Desulfobacterales bacterium CG07_land_8_20_14_0_80_52_14]